MEKITLKDLEDAQLCLREFLRKIESNLIKEALEKSGWKKSQAARLLKMGRTALRMKVVHPNFLYPEIANKTPDPL